jgi:hypothetical protein
MSRYRQGRPVAGLVALLTAPAHAARTRAIVLALGAAVAATLALAPFAHASVVWSAPQDLSAPGQSSGPEVAIDPLGRATAVWERAYGNDPRVQSARIAADGSPGAVHTLSPPGHRAFQPRVAVDSQGRATVVWYTFDVNGSNFRGRIQEVRIGADGSPGALHNLSGPPSAHPPQNPEVTIDSHDRATVVWQHYDGTNTRVQAVRIAANGTPGAVHALSPTGGDASDAQVAIDSRDRATVVWNIIDGSDSTVQSVRIRPDGTRGTVQDLSAGEPAGSAQVAVDSRGRATVIWSLFNTSRIQSRQINADGSLFAIRNLSPAGRQAQSPQVGTDSSNRATVVWQDVDNNKIQAVRIAPNGALGTVQDLSAAGQEAQLPSLAVDPQGRATVVWQRIGHSNPIQAARIRADGTSGWVKTLSAGGFSASGPAVAAGPQGRVIAVWSLIEAVNSYVVQFASGTSDQ